MNVVVATNPALIGDLMAERASAQTSAQEDAAAAAAAPQPAAPAGEPIRLDPEAVRPVLRAVLGPICRSQGVSGLTPDEEREGAEAFAALFGKWAPALFSNYPQELAVGAFVVGFVMVRKAEIEARRAAEPQGSGG